VIKYVSTKRKYYATLLNRLQHKCRIFLSKTELPKFQKPTVIYLLGGGGGRVYLMLHEYEVLNCTSKRSRCKRQLSLHTVTVT
jgi:hypothetical protein